MGILSYLSPDERLEYQAEKLEKKLALRRNVADFADPVEWIQENFYIPEINAPMKLYPSQIEPLKEALKIDTNTGLFDYSTICWSSIKKSAKSSIAASVGMWFAFQNPWSQVRIVANSLKQAYSRSYYYCTRAIALNPKWRNTIKVTGNTIKLPNGSTITAVPLNPDTEAGGGDDFVMYTEIWAWRHEAALRMWSETTLTPLLYGKSLRWAEGYCGYLGASPVLEDLYQHGVKEGRLINEKYEMYRNEAGRLFCLWQTKPHLPWQTKEYYEQEAATLTPNEFNRLHRNQWGTSVDTFVPPEWWHSCKANMPELKPKETIVLAMDAGVSDDSFALTGVRKWGADGVDVAYSRRWLPPQGGKISFTNPDNPGDRDTPEGEIRYLCDNYNVVMVAYDPYQLEDMANRLGREGVAWFFAFTQGSQRLTADSNLRTLIREKRLRHKGDPDLTEHVLNAGAKTDSEDSRIRIVKRAQHLKTDLAVALSMCADRILYLLNL